MRMTPQMAQMIQQNISKQRAAPMPVRPAKVTDAQMTAAVNRAKMGMPTPTKTPMAPAMPGRGPSMGVMPKMKAGGKVRGCGMAKKGIGKAKMY